MNMFRAFMELDEAYSTRQTMIDDIKKAGKNYNFAKYTDTQLYRMWQRLQKPTKVIKEPQHDLDLDFETREYETCECGRALTDAGYCPVCDDGEEDYESSLTEWVSASGQKVATTTTAAAVPAQAAPSASQNNGKATSGKYVVRIVSHGGRLRALATDGVHPAAWVAFPNDLRQFEGQQYEVDQLIWNGKNYRAAGNIVEI